MNKNIELAIIQQCDRIELLLEELLKRNDIQESIENLITLVQQERNNHGNN